MSVAAFAQAVLFQAPEIVQVQSDIEAHGPLVISAVDGVG
jgi:hypothetical protein